MASDLPPGRPLRYVSTLPTPPRCLVMGVLNLTPDSFSDGGRFRTVDDAVAHGLRLVQQGADIVDVGGESTRPGAPRVPEFEELRRVLPVVKELAQAGVTVSIDTMRAHVARDCVTAGAAMVNDVSGGLADDAMVATVADMGVPYVLMHWRSHSATMQQHTSYDDVAADVAGELRRQLDAAVEQGIDPSLIAVDPGIGFAKTGDQNWEVLARLEVLQELGQPVLVATSRKRFLGQLLAVDGELRPPRERDDATAATTALAAAAGAWCVRVHDVASSMDAVRVAARWGAAAAGPGGSREPAAGGS